MSNTFLSFKRSCLPQLATILIYIYSSHSINAAGQPKKEYLKSGLTYDISTNAKELGAPYREQLADNKTKARFIALILKQRKGDM